MRVFMVADEKTEVEVVGVALLVRTKKSINFLRLLSLTKFRRRILIRHYLNSLFLAK